MQAKRNMIKKIAFLSVVMLLSVQLGLLAGGFVKSGFRYDQVSTNYEPEMIKSQEYIFPLVIGYSYGEAFSFSASGSYAAAEYVYLFDIEDPERKPERLSDIALQGTVGYELKGLDHMVLLGLSLPNGNAGWEAKRLAADVPAEYVTGDDFGAGLASTVIYGLSMERSGLECSLAGGYIYSGEYDPLDDGQESKLDLGDLVIAMSSLRYELSERTVADLRVSYAHSLVTASIGEGEDDLWEDVFQQGDSWKITGEAGRFLYEQTRLRLRLTGELFAKNRNISDVQNPILQDSYRNGNRVGIVGLLDYQRGDKLLLTLRGGYKNVADNAGKDDYYDAGGYLVGCGLDGTYAAHKQFDVEMGVGYQFIDDKAEAYDSDDNATSIVYQRVTGRMGMKYYY